MKQFRILLSIFVVMAFLPLVAPPVAHADVDIYTSPGEHNVNGREWRTTCEPYSKTSRCRTEIKATQVSQRGGKFVQTTDWVFNNLTYASSPRSLWKANPVGGNGVIGGKVAWTSSDGRKWRTECDTAVTGRGGCRSYVEASIIETYSTSRGATAYRWKSTWVLNNMVRFGAITAIAPTKPAPTKPAPTKPAPTKPAPGDVYYKNCDAVRAAGKAPLFRGQPGYRSGLDRDNDGIACEP